MRKSTCAIDANYLRYILALLLAILVVSLLTLIQQYSIEAPLGKPTDSTPKATNTATKTPTPSPTPTKGCCQRGSGSTQWCYDTTTPSLDCKPSANTRFLVGQYCNPATDLCGQNPVPGCCVYSNYCADTSDMSSCGSNAIYTFYNESCSQRPECDSGCCQYYNPSTYCTAGIRQSCSLLGTFRKGFYCWDIGVCDAAPEPSPSPT